MALRKSTVVIRRDQQDTEDKVRGAARMGWFRGVQTRNVEHIRIMALTLELGDSRPRVREKKISCSEGGHEDSWCEGR